VPELTSLPTRDRLGRHSPPSSIPAARPLDGGETRAA
jgi:hypothetical protein